MYPRSNSAQYSWIKLRRVYVESSDLCAISNDPFSYLQPIYSNYFPFAIQDGMVFSLNQKQVKLSDLEAPIRSSYALQSGSTFHRYLQVVCSRGFNYLLRTRRQLHAFQYSGKLETNEKYKRYL